MLSTTIRHGDLVIEFHEDYTVQINRQSNGQAIQLSTTEWQYLLRVAEIQDWPMAPPSV